MDECFLSILPTSSMLILSASSATLMIAIVSLSFRFNSKDNSFVERFISVFRRPQAPMVPITLFTSAMFVLLISVPFEITVNYQGSPICIFKLISLMCIVMGWLNIVFFILLASITPYLETRCKSAAINGVSNSLTKIYNDKKK